MPFNRSQSKLYLGHAQQLTQLVRLEVKQTIPSKVFHFQPLHGVDRQPAKLTHLNQRHLDPEKKYKALQTVTFNSHTQKAHVLNCRRGLWQPHMRWSIILHICSALPATWTRFTSSKKITNGCLNVHRCPAALETNLENGAHNSTGALRDKHHVGHLGVTHASKHER